MEGPSLVILREEIQHSRWTQNPILHQCREDCRCRAATKPKTEITADVGQTLSVLF